MNRLLATMKITDSELLQSRTASSAQVVEIEQVKSDLLVANNIVAELRTRLEEAEDQLTEANIEVKAAQMHAEAHAERATLASERAEEKPVESTPEYLELRKRYVWTVVAFRRPVQLLS